MAGSLIIGEFGSGDISIRNVPAKDAKTNLSLTGGGTIGATVKVPLRDPNTGRSISVSGVKPWLSYLAFVEDGTVMEAGPITGLTYDDDARTLEVTATSLDAYYNRRFVLPEMAGVELPSTQEVRYEGLSLQTILKRLVQLAESWGLNAPPVIYEDDVSGPHQRTYKGIDMRTVGKAMESISAVSGGPDYRFLPRFREDEQGIEWLLETGSPEIAKATPHVWDLTAIVPQAKGLKITLSGETLTTNGYAFGEEGVDAKASNTFLTDLGYPTLEAEESRSDVVRQDTIQGYADALVDNGQFLREAWTFTARRGGTPAINTIRPGDYARIIVKDNPYLGTGAFTTRIMSAALSLASGDVSITCAPERMMA